MIEQLRLWAESIGQKKITQMIAANWGPLLFVVITVACLLGWWAGYTPDQVLEWLGYQPAP